MNSETFERLKELVGTNDILISSHGYDELADDGIFVKDVLRSFEKAIVIEDYPAFGKGPAVLLLQYDGAGNIIHTVWGIPKGKNGPAVLITAYRPDPERWTEDFTKRRD